MSPLHTGIRSIADRKDTRLHGVGPPLAFIGGLNELFVISGVVALVGAVLGLWLVRSQAFVVDRVAGARRGGVADGRGQLVRRRRSFPAAQVLP